MGRFIADPDVLLPEGNKIKGYSQQFGADVEKVYETIENMVATEYMSPEALAIKNEIDKYREDLNNMTKVIDQYGTFCVNSANKVVNNQNNIMDEIQ